MLTLSAAEVVDNDDVGAELDQPVDEVRTDEARTTRDEDRASSVRALEGARRVTLPVRGRGTSGHGSKGGYFRPFSCQAPPAPRCRSQNRTVDFTPLSP